jgi:hypothetical protein
MGKSTGPRSPRGKARSSQNAAKHWVVSGRILPDEQKEAAVLRSGFTEDFNPQCTIENELIDDLTLNRLIKRRIDKAFTREFSKAAIGKEMQFVDDLESANLQYWLRFAGRRYWFQREHGERLRATRCIAELNALKRRISARGPQPEDAAILRCIFGDQPTEHAALAMHELTLVVEKQTVDGAVPADEMERKDAILDTLESEINMQKSREEIENNLEAIEIASDLQEPAGPTLDILLRYRASTTREFKVLLDSLQRVRSLRRSAA